ncbi:hypothetical protein [Pseudomarimonas arenosa]|uniref:DUF3368 domain-containing protein n=1 Tax=Pseudomarimonas arenosa TaxID=2774145 RepID=A0AAW3ZMV7_9GAMM|nr:hypothetical protein [Pseudomarimonas arenosa]MBD8525974.1 hypothetical protein [Pseudomarimonas arenosa]
MRIIVADSGPLIALAGLDGLPWPVALWGRVLVPRTVIHECVERAATAGSASILRACEKGVLEVCEDEALADELIALSLDPGEKKAIALALRLEGSLLIDEQRGRRAAAHLRIPHIGTCGTLVLAKRAGLVPQVAPCSTRVHGSGYFLSPQLIQDTLRLAEEI